jgi:hypothetical protein
MAAAAPGTFMMSPQTNSLRAGCWSIPLLAVLAVGSSAAEPPHAELHRIDGAAIHGQLTRCDEEFLEIRRHDGSTATIARSDSLRLDFDAPPPPEPIPQSWLLFANGDRLAAQAQGITDDRLIARWSRFPDRRPLAIPLEFLRAAIVRPPELRREHERLLSMVFSSQFEADTFFLTDGGRLTGELTGSDESGWPLETSLGPVAVDPQHVRALALNSSLVVEAERSPNACLVTFRDGSWITFNSLAFGETADATGLTIYGEELGIALAEIQSIAFFGPRVRRLDQLDPEQVSSDYYLGGGPGLRINRNACGGFLTLRGREYPHGIGMAGGVSSTWKLTENDHRFQATIGIDDCAGDRGSVRFIVELDRRPVYTSDVLRGGHAPLDIAPLDLAGADELTLRVDYAEYGDIRDFADWCEPLLLP